LLILTMRFAVLAKCRGWLGALCSLERRDGCVHSAVLAQPGTVQVWKQVLRAGNAKAVSAALRNVYIVMP